MHGDGMNQNNYDNERVAQIREELGEFNYDEDPNHGNYPVVWRNMVELENHARYEGEW